MFPHSPQNAFALPFQGLYHEFHFALSEEHIKKKATVKNKSPGLGAPKKYHATQIHMLHLLHAGFKLFELHLFSQKPTKQDKTGHIGKVQKVKKQINRTSFLRSQWFSVRAMRPFRYASPFASVFLIKSFNASFSQFTSFRASTLFWEGIQIIRAHDLKRHEKKQTVLADLAISSASLRVLESKSSRSLDSACSALSLKAIFYRYKDNNVLLRANANERQQT